MKDFNALKSVPIALLLFRHHRADKPRLAHFCFSFRTARQSARAVPFRPPLLTDAALQQKGAGGQGRRKRRRLAPNCRSGSAKEKEKFHSRKNRSASLGCIAVFFSVKSEPCSKAVSDAGVFCRKGKGGREGNLEF